MDKINVSVVGEESDKINVITCDTVLLESFISANELFASRNKEYANAFEKHGVVIEAFFPNGVTLKTEDDFKRFGLVNSIINKLVRYCRNFEDGHIDSVRDAAVYCHMLDYVDTKGDKSGL